VGDEKSKKRLKAANIHPTGSNVDLLWDDIVLTAKLLGRDVPITRAKRVDICKFTFGRQIGAGPISRIILATKDPSYDMGEDGSINEVALKAISKEKLNDRRKAKMYQRALMYEKKTMYKCRGIHPFILNLYATAIGRDDVYFVLEYAPNRDLQKWSRDMGGFPESCVRFYTACVVDALEAMHKVKVYHRDVKPENVFLDKDFLPKLGDFGCSISEGDMVSFMGTPQYMPPELVAHQVDTSNVRATDYWSLGVTVYYLLYGLLCFGDGHDYVVMTR
jgi:3-phosphoinositide dependent protein kinase-1